MSELRTNVLVVDDEAPIRRVLRRCFEQEGFTVHEAADSEQTLALLSAQPIDLITLDISLDGEDGLDIARQIRNTNSVPIIMVSGKGDLIDTVVGLEVGADDYITKPFELREVLARVRAVLRRHQLTRENAVSKEMQSSQSDHSQQFKFNDWSLKCATRELFDPDGNGVPLTTAEFDLLELFVRRSGKILSRDQIMDSLKGHHWNPNDRTIDNQVARLRKKLDASSSAPKLIKTIRGSGYLFTADVSVA